MPSSFFRIGSERLGFCLDTCHLFAAGYPLASQRAYRSTTKQIEQTQAALQFLIRADLALHFKHADIHEAVAYGLDALLKAQFPNGAFPQGWLGPVEHKPVAKAKFPDYDWKTGGKIKNYWECYTLNDNLAGTVADKVSCPDGLLAGR